MGRYLPGHKDGGPLRTIVNLTEALGDQYEFYIGCYDRDHGDSKAYPDIKEGSWNRIGKSKVFYVAPGGFTEDMILRLSKNKDMIYLCNFYEVYGYKTLLLKRRGRITCPVAVASMGVFSKEAQAQKAFKKKAFIAVCKRMGLFKNITWSVTSELEAFDVKRVIGKDVKYIIAEDLPRTVVPGRSRKYDGTLKIVFLSRICEHKNPGMLIDAVQAMKNRDIEVGFYGPIQEEAYWNSCLKKLKDADFKWKYGGDVLSEQVQEVLSGYDVFVLPSKSENYGHVIFEALSVGCIPVISDRTPWNLEGAGYVLPLKVDSFINVLDQIAEMERRQRDKLADAAVKLAMDRVKQSKEATGYHRIFG